MAISCHGCRLVLSNRAGDKRDAGVLLNEINDALQAVQPRQRSRRGTTTHCSNLIHPVAGAFAFRCVRRENHIVARGRKRIGWASRYLSVW
jgi:hypothetical protein